MIKFRIKQIEGIGYFAQAKEGFFSNWETIGRHHNGYGLYPENHTEFPLPKKSNARTRIDSYKEWCNSTIDATTTYHY